ncbi:MAG: hypothetical protein PPFGHCPK_01453 (plasmid) [Spiroplasma endosymbiont of Drosophila atripex]|nr:MAG: hypothetical protein PPFGHCPK_01453 [Spiroplasma endosymbiont of Drosophila atripex]
MKKLLSMLTIGILTSTSVINTNIVLNTNLNKKNNINNMKNLKSDPIVNWKDLGKKGGITRVNDNLLILDGGSAGAWLIDKNGEFIKELKINGNFTNGTFTSFNDSKIIFHSVNGMLSNLYMMNSNGDFTDLGKNGTFSHFNNQLGIFHENDTGKNYFLNSFGQFTEIKKDGHSILWGSFLRFSDNLGLMIINGESWLMNYNGDFIKKLDKNIRDLFNLNERKAIVNIRTNPHDSSLFESWLMNSNGDFIKKLDKKGSFTRLNDNLGVFVDNSNESWLMNSNGDFIKKLDKKGSFTRLNDNLGVFVDNSNESWLMNSNGDFIKKLDKKGNKSQITYINDTMLGFQDFIGESYILSITSNPDDIAGLKASVHFEPENQSQIITDINTSKYQGKGSNGNVNFNIENENITEVKIDNEVQSITDHKVQKIVTSEGQHEIIITNTLTTPLKYNLYIKKELLKDDIIPTSSSTKHSNYVGIISKQNLTNTQIPNLIDVLQYSAEIKFDYNDFLLDSNKYYTLDKDFKLINPIDVFKDTKISVSGNYLIQATDLIHNTWQQYLTIGIPTITDFRTTEQWKQAENWALKNGYKQSDLDKMNANEIKDLLSKYNPSPTPSPTPNPNNNIGWYIFLGIFLGLITFGIGGFYINKFVIKPIRNKRSDIKSDKYVAEQMELSKKWKEQEEKEKQARDKNKGGK